MAVGNVYVFNATPNSMLLLLNNHILANNITGVAKSSSYAPASTSAPRNSATGDPGNATFGGQNTLIVSFTDGTSQTYPVNIDGGIVQIDSDLQLYIFFDEVVLVSPAGSTGGTGTSKVIEGSAASKEQLDQVKALATT